MQTNVLARQVTPVLLILATSLMTAIAGETPKGPIPKGVTRVVRGARPDGVNVEIFEPPSDFITDEQHAEMRKDLAASVERLRSEGKLQTLTPDVHPLFGWPLRMAPGLTDPGLHFIAAFVDLDPNYPGFLLDYNCGTRTYDSGNGYNHQGTDFFLWPWGWRKLDRGEVQIVAAAPGQIIYRRDGNFDHNCVNNNSNWNAVYVQHADGSLAWYGHMKNGSVTKKMEGEFVNQGEYLGVVGSSGNSPYPHLHFEVYDANSSLIDPWSGPCNNLSPVTWWASQRPYVDSAINQVTTGSAPVENPPCPGAEVSHAQSSFPLGATIYFSTYYHDQYENQLSTFNLYRPDGSLFSQWTNSIPSGNGMYEASLVSSSFNMPVDEMQGTWKFTVDYLAEHHERLFSYGSPAACGIVPETAQQGGPLVLQKMGGSVKLTWGASCNPADTDYSVYEGAIGNFSSHTSLTCTTSGGLTTVVTPGAGGRYFLIGTENGSYESSLGLMSSGAERPPGIVACAPRFSLPCP